MISLSRKTDYALLALAHLALRRQDSTGAASAREIADAYTIPLPVLMNVLKDLAKARIVTSSRGAGGGYSLALEPEQVSLMEVVTAIEGPVHLMRCVGDLPVLGQECPTACRCPVESAVKKLHGRLNRFFEATTLADLMQPQAEVPLEQVMVGGA